MASLKNLSLEELQNLKNEYSSSYKSLKSKNLSLDMTRGKPSSDQLNLSKELLNTPLSENDWKQYGIDGRNYGGLDGFPEAKKFFSQILEVPESGTIVGGNSSLALMHDTIIRNILYGNCDSEKPWKNEPEIKFICPTPGYDRHFSICEHNNIKMIPVGMNENGPDMDQVEKLVKSDPAIKGIWCVPKYSNPTGVTYSDEVVDRLASMETKAKDFRIFWDNAYAVHFLDGHQPIKLKNILTTCTEHNNENRVYLYCSTSKITFAGAGVAAFGSSKGNVKDFLSHLKFQTIGPDKINTLRHLKFFDGKIENVLKHMNEHARVIKPKFQKVLEIFNNELGNLEIATWTNPKGGYFISLDTLPGLASEIVSMAEEAGIKLTKSGATFPYGKDPNNKNIRIAPTLPPLEEVEIAMDGVALCVKLASVQKLISENN